MYSVLGIPEVSIETKALLVSGEYVYNLAFNLQDHDDTPVLNTT